MKSPVQGWTPARLLVVMGASYGLVTIAVVALTILSWHQRASAPARHYGLGMIVVGLIAGLVAELYLQRGISSGRWTEEALAPARRVVSHPSVQAVAWSMMALFFVSGIVAPLQKTTLGVFFVAVPMSIMRASQNLRPQQDSKTLEAVWLCTRQSRCNRNSGDLIRPLDKPDFSASRYVVRSEGRYWFQT